MGIIEKRKRKVGGGVPGWSDLQTMHGITNKVSITNVGLTSWRYCEFLPLWNMAQITTYYFFINYYETTQIH